MNAKRVGWLLATIVLCGCVSQGVAWEGVNYPNRAAFEQALDARLANIANGVSPLSRPITRRGLIIMVPSKECYDRMLLARHKYHSPQPNSITMDMVREQDPNYNAAYKATMNEKDVIIKKNIFSNHHVMYYDSEAEPVATDDNDIIMYTNAKENSPGQIYYYSSRNGKQVIPVDKGLPPGLEQTNNYLESIKSLALQ